MKIAVSASGQNLDAAVDPRFGRCGGFIIVDPETLQFESVANPGVSASGGAGIQAAQLVAKQGAEIVITGNCGPNAFETLKAAGIKVITGMSGTVKEAVEKYKANALSETQGPTVPSHSGMKKT
ncbi:MAG: NifB/NifX family molybdenum-iron cluster-binding protein [Planctomycetes bacterium]|nr:NifB/NifX family molybdenum-iron cluster-binding protein [Planctomycetota bacterium]